jgi:hypothetical protein
MGRDRRRCLASARRSGAPRPASGRIASAVSFAPFDPAAVDNQASLSFADLWVKNRAWPGHHIFIKGRKKPWVPTELVCGLKAHGPSRATGLQAF